MKKIKFGDFGDLKGAEIIDTVIGGGGNFRLERILSKSSAYADGFWYDQPEFEFALVLDGFAELESESGGLVKLEKFEGVVIPPHFKHRVARTSPRCLWLTVFAAEMFALQQ